MVVVVYHGYGGLAMAKHLRVVSTSQHPLGYVLLDVERSNPCSMTPGPVSAGEKHI